MGKIGEDSQDGLVIHGIHRDQQQTTTKSFKNHFTVMEGGRGAITPMPEPDHSPTCQGWTGKGKPDVNGLQILSRF
ncbi:MAG: hypothetical protein Alpg2KO_24450 [Alphaproteobacteria bacterium]